MSKRIAFIGGGNMASAIIGGLLSQDFSPRQIDVVEPFAPAQEKLHSSFGLTAQAQAGSFLSAADLVVWAVKPQAFRQAAQQVQSYTQKALHLSVAAGIRSDSIAHWLGTERIVRAMPNTPALIGKGISALFARERVSHDDKVWIDEVIASTGELVWVDTEDKLDAVTALSGSGPAYLFYFMEAMSTAGIEMGLTREQAHQLTIATFVGAGALAQASSESPKILRQRVTSKGGTTEAAIASMEDDDLQAQLINAIYTARQRAKELGDEFGAD
ncbi:MAG: pyrroline-5-carboxylate reductase [Comamonadaceae bacterium]